MKWFIFYAFELKEVFILYDKFWDNLKEFFKFDSRFSVWNDGVVFLDILRWRTVMITIFVNFSFRKLMIHDTSSPMIYVISMQSTFKRPQRPQSLKIWVLANQVNCLFKGNAFCMRVEVLAVKRNIDAFDFF